MVAELEHGVGKRRTAWRFIASVEQEENFVDNEHQATHAKECAVNLELRKIGDGILALTDRGPINSGSTGKPKACYYEMKGDYY